MARSSTILSTDSCIATVLKSARATRHGRSVVSAHSLPLCGEPAWARVSRIEVDFRRLPPSVLDNTVLNGSQCLLFVTARGDPAEHKHEDGDEAHSIPRNATATVAHRTGSGYGFAESCQAELRQWSHASSSYGREHGHRSTSYYTSDMTVATVSPGSTKVTSLITLCDGYPRVVGQVSYDTGKTSFLETYWTNTNPTFVFASYPTPAPCSINPEDCKLLYSSWTRHYQMMTKGPGFGGLLDPPCTTETSTPSYTTDSKGNVCDNCLVAGSDLCNKTAETMSVAPTGYGQNTFVTLGTTITSPSVAVSIGGLSRVDKCGTTVTETIIPVLPEDVSSVNGARAFFTHKPFNFADLNYKCISDPDVIYVATSDRIDCYREVPASAYLWGYANAAGAALYATNPFANSTIWPNYQPQVLPPNTLTEAIRSLWGPDCYIHPDGIWDPPIALGHETTIRLPAAGPGATTKCTTPTSNPAMPALPTYAQPSASAGHETPAAPGDDPSQQAASATSRLNDGNIVNVIHTTVLTLPAKNGVETLKAIYATDWTYLVDAGSMIEVNDISKESGAHQTSYDPEQTSLVHQQVVTLNGAEYTVNPMRTEGFELIGQSTTIQVNNDDVQSTRSVRTLALATGVSSARGDSQNTGDHVSAGRTSIMTSSSGLRRARVTCLHLPHLAMFVLFVHL